MRKKLEEWFKVNLAPDFNWVGSLLWDEALSRHTYYRIGGPAPLLAIPKGKTELKTLLRACNELKIPYFVLGAGSNLLVSDQGFEGVVIKTGRMNLDLNLIDLETVRAGGSVAISSFLKKAGQEGWQGLELWTGIPGTVGGAIAMNAGTHLGESAAIVSRVEVLLPNGNEMLFEKPDLKFEYRKNLFIPPGAVVYSADFEIHQGDPNQVKDQIRTIHERRKATQPIEYPSCGSVFKNPKTHQKHAWQVIDELGLRGYRDGDAQFSEKHPNFIINLGQASAQSVKGLIEKAKAEALTKLGIQLEEEVKFLGKF